MAAAVGDEAAAGGDAEGSVEILPPHRVERLDALFSAEECAALVARAEAQGLTPATVKIQATTLDAGKSARLEGGARRGGAESSAAAAAAGTAGEAGGAASSSSSSSSSATDAAAASSGPDRTPAGVPSVSVTPSSSSSSSSAAAASKPARGSFVIDTQALVDDIRNNDSCVLKDAGELAEALWARVEPRLPDGLRHVDLEAAVPGAGGMPANPLAPAGRPGTAVCLSADKMRVYRYREGHRFVRHYDGYEFGSVVYGGKKKRGGARAGPEPVAVASLLLYLNHGTFGGGQTNFFTTQGQKLASVEPHTGAAIVYSQRLLHEGAVVTKKEKKKAEDEQPEGGDDAEVEVGEKEEEDDDDDEQQPAKYVLRCDVMYVADNELEAYHRARQQEAAAAGDGAGGDGNNGGDGEEGGMRCVLS